MHTYAGSGASVAAFNTKVAPFDDVRVRQALVMALDRKKMSQALTNGLARPATNPYGDGSWVKCKDDGALPFDLEKAKALIKDYGKPVDFKMLVTATPRGRASGQVFQQLWKQAGANMEIEQVDQATIPAARLHAPVPGDADGGSSISPIPMCRCTPISTPAARSRSPTIRIRNSTRCSKMRGSRPTRTSASSFIAPSAGTSTRKRSGSGRFQNTYYAMSTAKVKGLPKMYSGVIDVSRVWLE